MRTRTAIAMVTALTLLLSACSTETVPRSHATGSPAPARTVVELVYRVSEDLTVLDGTEMITFTPDQEVCEIVLRAWPNKPATARQGNRMVIRAVTVDGVETPHVEESAGAPADSPGTLVEVQLPRCISPGTSVDIRADFEVTLGEDTDERVGYSRRDGQAWFASAFPMLDYQRGVGWIRDDAVAVVGEMTTTETFELRDLAVTAPSRYQVAAVGEAGDPIVNESDGTVTHHFSAPALRDVSVLVGDIEVFERTTADVRVHVALPVRMASEAMGWQDAVDAALLTLVDYLGPHPYEDLWVAVIPTQSEGLESTGGIQLGDLSPRRDAWLFTHEIAHQWVYGLVGNNQARHPWMDESVVSMIQAVVDDPGKSPEPTFDYPDVARERMGLAMEDFLQFERPGRAYLDAVYVAGSDILVQARDDAGHAAFDEALRAYIARNAHQIATPEDFARSFADLPAVVDALEAAHALP